MKLLRNRVGLCALGMGLLFLASPAFAQESADYASSEVGYAVDNVLLFVCAVLVLFMQAGFAMVEVGLNAAKNTVNILFKNVMDLSVGALLFYVVGFGIMYPGLYMTDELAKAQGYEDKTEMVDGETTTISAIDQANDGANQYFAFGGLGIYGGADDYNYEQTSGTNPQVDWFFQAVFAATAATIVSGAVAGRMKFGAYLIYSAILTGLIYPVSGYWKWGGGFLADMGFQDFAGSAVVHAVGGFAGLAGAILLGPRLGRYVNGKSMPMPGHNLAFATLGVFVLWVGWYGFNPGSQLAFADGANTNAVVLIAVNTTLAAAGGAVIATLLSWGLFNKPDLSMALNGALGGLVGITACCDCFTNLWAIAIGAVAGAIVVAGVLLLDKLQIDDPVGAFPVHGLCGIWGCLAAGLPASKHVINGDTTFGVQLFSTLVICAWAFATMFAVFAALKAAGALRVSAEEENAGLDVSEHGMRAYSDVA